VIPTDKARYPVTIASCGDHAIALCNDYTIWMLVGTTWTEVPELPQPDPDAGTGVRCWRCGVPGCNPGCNRWPGFASEGS